MKKYGLKALFTVILFLYLGYHYFTGLQSYPFHIDEYLFTKRSYYFDLFLKRDFSDWRWYGNDSSAQPKVGPYIFGITLHLAGIDNIEQELTKRGFKDNLNLKVGERLTFPQLELIEINRITAVLFSLGAFILVFILTSKIKGLVFANISTLFLGTNSLMQQSGRRAMTDSMQIFFFFLSLLLIFMLLGAYEKKKFSRVYLLSIAIGISIALGVGVKVSGILIILFTIVIFLYLGIFKYLSKKALIPLLTSSVIIASTFMLLFYALHPYLYHDPFRKFIRIFSERLIESEAANMLAFPKTAVYSRVTALRLIIENTLLPSGQYVNFRSQYLPIDLVLFSLGFSQMGHLTLKNLRQKKKISGETLLIIWVLLVSISLILYLRNNWPRYYLPTVAAVTIVEAYAMSALLNGLITKLALGKEEGNYTKNWKSRERKSKKI